MAVLIHLAYSPWSEKARWALDHHRVVHRRVAYVPMLGEPMLRLVSRRFRGRVTVPVYLEGSRVLSDSFEIAQHAERVGTGAPLFPPGRLDEIARWNARGESILAAGRALVVERSRDHAGARAESIPPFIPKAFHGAMDPIVRAGFDHVARKYRLAGAAPEVNLRAVRAGLEEARVALRERPYLLDGFTYADIALATALQAVCPVDSNT